MINQKNKNQIRKLWDDLDDAGLEDIYEICADHFARDCQWNGPAPFYLQCGPKAIAQTFWFPLKHAIADLKLETHMFFGGNSSASQRPLTRSELQHFCDGYLNGYNYRNGSCWNNAGGGVSVNQEFARRWLTNQGY